MTVFEEGYSYALQKKSSGRTNPLKNIGTPFDAALQLRITISSA